MSPGCPASSLSSFSTLFHIRARSLIHARCGNTGGLVRLFFLKDVFHMVSTLADFFSPVFFLYSEEISKQLKWELVSSLNWVSFWGQSLHAGLPLVVLWSFILKRFHFWKMKQKMCLKKWKLGDFSPACFYFQLQYIYWWKLKDFMGTCSDSDGTLVESRQSFCLLKHLNLTYFLPYFGNLGVVMLIRSTTRFSCL